MVADALSRITSNVNYLNADAASTSTTDSVATVHSALQDASDLIPHVEAPINVFRNQLVFDPDRLEYSFETPHTGYVRHLIPIDSTQDLLPCLMKYLKPLIINGIKIPESYLQSLQERCRENLPGYKLRITQRLVTDVAGEEETIRIINTERTRAHRNPKEMKLQILENFISPEWPAALGR